MVEAATVIVEIGFDVKVLCREAMSEEVGERAGLGYEIAKGIVGERQDTVGEHVAVYVVCWFTRRRGGAENGDVLV